MTRTYLTLEDLILTVFDDNDILEDLELGKAGDDGASPKTTYFKSIIGEYFQDTTLESLWNSAELNILFCTYIYPKYKELAVSYYDDEATETEITEKYKSFLVKILTKIRKSKDEYIKLINLYDSIKDNLLDSIKSQTKFNDTPQTVTSAGVTSYDDTYNTTVTTNYNDGASKIARIAEIEAYIKDYYESWAEYVCKGVFIYED